MANIVDMHNYSSQADHTFQNYGGFGVNRPISTNLAWGVKTGIEHPKCPTPPHGLSVVHIGHRGCCHCGGENTVRDCSRKGEDGASKYL